MGSFVLIGIKVGAAYALGDYLGGKGAAALNIAASDGLRRGVKIGTGVLAYAVLSIVL